MHHKCPNSDCKSADIAHHEGKLWKCAACGLVFDPRLCNHKTRSGKRCKRWPVKGNTRCQNAGGLSDKPGPLHKDWKHGRTSLWNAMPESMRASFEESLDDPELISLRQNLAAVDAMIDERTRGIGEKLVRWRDLAELARDVEAAEREAGSHPVGSQARSAAYAEYQALKKDLMKAIATGKDQMGALDELASLHERRSRIAAAEVKRLASQQQSLTLADAIQLMHTFVTDLMLVIRETVDDRETLRQLRRTLSERNLLDGRAFIESIASPRRGN